MGWAGTFVQNPTLRSPYSRQICEESSYSIKRVILTSFVEHRSITLISKNLYFSIIFATLSDFTSHRYVFWSDRFRLRIIKLAHYNVVEEHSNRLKCHKLINQIYSWLNMHQFIKRFVQNCHICKKFKSSRQRYEDWLQSLFSSEWRWRDVFMNYVRSLNLNIFIRIIYR
jgi:hypothetical protein